MTSWDKNPIRVLLVGCPEVVCKDLREFIGARNIEIVGERQTMSQAISAAWQLKPDIVVMDFLLPDGAGLDACRKIVSQTPDIRVVILTAFDDEDAKVEGILAGADGYLLKSCGVEALLDAIESVAAGKPLLEPTVIPALLKKVRAMTLQTAGAKGLTRQEHRILYLVAQGKTNKQIADALGLSDKTVKNYMSNIFQKLQVTRRSQAAVMFSQLVSK